LGWRFFFTSLIPIANDGDLTAGTVALQFSLFGDFYCDCGVYCYFYCKQYDLRDFMVANSSH
jgi:hypothetical protein